MRRISTSILSAAALAAALAAASAGGADTGRRYDSDAEMTVREESRQTYDLTPNAQLRVRGIAGPVTIETGDFAQAELHIVRMAATQRDLDCYRTQVSATRSSLTIEHVQDRDRDGCDNIRSRQEVRLRLPRSMSIDLQTIAGAVDIGATDGMVRLSSIAGRTSLARVRTAEISSIAGRLTMGLAPVGDEGVEVSSVAGGVELNVEPGVDADVRVSSVIGGVSGFGDSEEGYGNYRARIGQGGGRVSLSSIVGSVRLRRP
jgi:hypothetical protein